MAWYDYLPHIASLLSLAGLIAKVIFDSIKARDESETSQVERDKIHQDISLKYADELRQLKIDIEKERTELTQRISALEEEVERQKCVIEKQATTIRRLRASNNSLKHRADKLERQVIELGGIPPS